MWLLSQLLSYFRKRQKAYPHSFSYAAIRGVAEASKIYSNLSNMAFEDANTTFMEEASKYKAYFPSSKNVVNPPRIISSLQQRSRNQEVKMFIHALFFIISKSTTSNALALPILGNAERNVDSIITTLKSTMAAMGGQAVIENIRTITFEAAK